jgi:hypothetical protein
MWDAALRQKIPHEQQRPDTEGQPDADHCNCTDTTDRPPPSGVGGLEPRGLRLRRRALGLKQAELAERLAVSANRWRAGSGVRSAWVVIDRWRAPWRGSSAPMRSRLIARAGHPLVEGALLPPSGYRAPSSADPATISH